MPFFAFLLLLLWGKCSNITHWSEASRPMRDSDTLKRFLIPRQEWPSSDQTKLNGNIALDNCWCPWLFHSDNIYHLPKLSYWTILDRPLYKRPVHLDDLQYLHIKRTNRFASLCDDISIQCFDRGTTAYWLFVGTLARGGRNRCQKLEEEFEFICKTVIAPTLIPSPSI